MMPQQPNNLDYIEGLTNRVTGLRNELRQYQELFSAMVLMAADDKGRVRIPAPILNKLPKIDTIQWDGKRRDDGTPVNFIINITMEDE
jgi:hypothetical protein